MGSTAENTRHGILKDMEVPDYPVGVDAEEEIGGLRTHMEIGTENADKDMADEEKVGRQEEREQSHIKERQAKDKAILRTAEEFSKKRKNQEIPGEEINAMLKENGITPMTIEAAKFMADWDHKQAQDTYAEAMNRFDAGINISKEEIATLDAQYKKATGKEHDKLQSAIKANEDKIHELEDARHEFIYGKQEESATDSAPTMPPPPTESDEYEKEETPATEELNKQESEPTPGSAQAEELIPIRQELSETVAKPEATPAEEEAPAGEETIEGPALEVEQEEDEEIKTLKAEYDRLQTESYDLMIKAGKDKKVDPDHKEGERINDEIDRVNARLKELTNAQTQVSGEASVGGEQEAETIEEEPQKQEEEREIEVGDVIQVPDGSKVTVTGKKWFGIGDKFKVEGSTSDGMKKLEMSGEVLRSGELVENEDDSGQGETKETIELP